MYVEMNRGVAQVVPSPNFSAAHEEQFSSFDPNSCTLGPRRTRKVPDQVTTYRKNGGMTHKIVRGRVPTLHVITCPVVLKRLEDIATERASLEARLKELREDELKELADGYRRGEPAKVEPIKEATIERRRLWKEKQLLESASTR